MSEYKHLKDEIYYSDLYDRLTVEQARRIEEGVKSSTVQDEKLTSEERKDALRWVNHVSIYAYTGERYLSKKDTINKWMALDKAKDEKIENTLPPKGVTCLNCGSKMHLESRDLRELKGTDQVLFLFRCDEGCKVGRAFYENGQEYIPKIDLCPKCHNQVEAVVKSKGDIIKTTYNCSSCGHSYSETLDLRTKKEKPDPNYETDRRRFCIDEKAGEEYRDSKYKMGELRGIMDRIEEKEKHKELYDAVAKIKKLPIAEVQKLLVAASEKDGYTNLQFQPPELGKDVIVSFTAVDNKNGRSDYNSKQDLKKLIGSALEGTNWKLMSDGISYRVGYVSGRLRCIEREEDLVDQVKGISPDL